MTQLTIIRACGRQSSDDLPRIHHPVLVANGDQDKMVQQLGRSASSPPKMRYSCRCGLARRESSRMRVKPKWN
jgi:hypothetical protein